MEGLKEQEMLEVAGSVRSRDISEDFKNLNPTDQLTDSVLKQSDSSMTDSAIASQPTRNSPNLLDTEFDSHPVRSDLMSDSYHKESDNFDSFQGRRSASPDFMSDPLHEKVTATPDKGLSSDDESEKDASYLQRDTSPVADYYKDDVPSYQSKSEALYSDDISFQSKSETLYSRESTPSDITKENPIPEIFEKESSPTEPFAKEAFPSGFEYESVTSESTLAAKQLSESPYEPQLTPEPDIMFSSSKIGNLETEHKREDSPDFLTQSERDKSDFIMHRDSPDIMSEPILDKSPDFMPQAKQEDTPDFMSQLKREASPDITIQHKRKDSPDFMRDTIRDKSPDFNMSHTTREESPDFMSHPTRETQDFMTEPTRETLDFMTEPTRETPDFMTEPTRETPDFMTEPTRETPDFMTEPTRETPDFMTEPTREPSDFMNEPTREKSPDFTTQRIRDDSPDFLTQSKQEETEHKREDSPDYLAQQTRDEFDETNDGQHSPFEHIDPVKELGEYYQTQEPDQEKEVEAPSFPTPEPDYKAPLSKLTTCADGWLQKLPPLVLDLIYWRDTKKSGIVYGAGMMFLILLRWMSLISVVSYMSLITLTATVSFRIYKNVMQAIQKTQDGHPFKEFLELDVALPADKVQHTTDVALQKLNNSIHELRRLFLVEDYVDSLKFAVLLWCFTYIGSWFNSLTLIILAYAGLFTLPKVYEINQTQIDQYIDLVRKQFEEIHRKIRSLIPLGGSKEKAQ